MSYHRLRHFTTRLLAVILLALTIGVTYQTLLASLSTAPPTLTAPSTPLRSYLPQVLKAWMSVPASINADLGQEFSLAVGQSAVITGQNLAVKFEDVVEDSRCPSGAICIWEGRVSCLVELKDSTSSHRIVLTQPGLTDQYAVETYDGFQLTFKVEPYPEVDHAIARGEYRLLLTVSRDEGMAMGSTKATVSDTIPP